MRYLIIFVSVGALFSSCKSHPKTEPEQEVTTKTVLSKKLEIPTIPENPKTLFELKKNWSFGWEHYKNGEYQKATKYFWIVSKLDTFKRFPTVFCYLSNCYNSLGKPDSASIIDEIGKINHADILCD